MWGVCWGRHSQGVPLEYIFTLYILICLVYVSISELVEASRWDFFYTFPPSFVCNLLCVKYCLHCQIFWISKKKPCGSKCDPMAFQGNNFMKRIWSCIYGCLSFIRSPPRVLLPFQFLIRDIVIDAIFRSFVCKWNISMFCLLSAWSVSTMHSLALLHYTFLPRAIGFSYCSPNHGKRNFPG